VRKAPRQTSGRPIPAAAWVTAAVLATVLQWGLFFTVTGVPVAYALEPGVLFELVWPVLVGALLAWGLASAGTKLPDLPVGDISARGAVSIERVLSRLAGRIARFETHAHQWQMSSLALAMALIAFVALQAWLTPR
jgi:hypothetical protein